MNIRMFLHILVTATLASNITPLKKTGTDSLSTAWHLSYLHLSEAHAISRGRGIIVAVLDSGVSRHPDITPNLLPGISYAPKKARMGGSTKKMGTEPRSPV